MSSNIVWHEASINKSERREKIIIIALSFGLQAFPLQESHLSPIHWQEDYLNKGINPLF